MLGGLINKMGLNTGGPLIEAAEDNAKGFFERIDVVLQNDAIMSNQRIHYSHNTYRYDVLQGLSDISAHILPKEGDRWFNEGRRGLKFLNDPSNYPWMLKDPRLCITFRSWLPFLNFIPAVIFTYRHPLDVAMSMHKRDFEQFAISKGLKLWYVYNKMAVTQSHDLCRIVTSHRMVMKQPSTELNRIYDELIACGINNLPDKSENSNKIKQASETDIKDFIDISLQHGRTTLKDTSCEMNLDIVLPPNKSWPDPSHTDIIFYRECIRVYCAMEDGSAFHPNFKWDDNIKDN